MNSLNYSLNGAIMVYKVIKVKNTDRTLYNGSQYNGKTHSKELQKKCFKNYFDSLKWKYSLQRNFLCSPSL